MTAPDAFTGKLHARDKLGGVLAVCEYLPVEGERLYFAEHAGELTCEACRKITACLLCAEPVAAAAGVALMQGMRAHCAHVHREELRARMENKRDSVIERLWLKYDISFRRGDL